MACFTRLKNVLDKSNVKYFGCPASVDFKNVQDVINNKPD